MKKLLGLLTVLFASLSVSSCDFYERHIMHIDNQTDDSIVITFSEKAPFLQRDWEILPHSECVIHDMHVPLNSTDCDYIRIREGEVDIQFSSGRTLKKEIWDANNWNCKGSEGLWEQTFVITEDDLE